MDLQLWRSRHIPREWRSSLDNSGSNKQVFANVDPSKGYKGITCFVLSKDMGVQIAKKEAKVGLHDFIKQTAPNRIARYPGVLHLRSLV